MTRNFLAILSFYLFIRFITNDINSETCSARANPAGKTVSALRKKKTCARFAQKMHPARSRPRSRKIATVHITRSRGCCNAGFTFRRYVLRLRFRICCFSRERYAARRSLPIRFSGCARFISISIDVTACEIMKPG